jgi:tRNA A-37 threonylcarbamoyl transferase component Bud32
MGPIDTGTALAGRFEVLRPLGSGALAEVFAARDGATGEEVAVKVLHAHAAEDPELADRFRRELGLTRRLDHPGIVRVFELYEHRDERGARPFISMELLRGETLAERLERGALPPGEARRILREALLAAQAAHAQGVVHRDLKPQNLFLLEDGRVKLLDFGMARAAGSARHTAASTVLGTPGYLAPEVLEGTGGDVRSDLYSLGAVFFELLTGKRAFPALEPFAVLRQQREGAPDLRKALPGVAASDAALLARALTPDPEQRYLDAEQMLCALGGGNVAEAPPPLPAVTVGAFDVQVAGAPQEAFPLASWKRALRFERSNVGLHALARRFGVANPSSAVLLCGTVANGVDERSAESLVQVCQEHGLAAVAVPARAPGRLGGWLGEHFKAAAVAACGVAFALAQAALYLDPQMREGGVLGSAFASLFGLEVMGVAFASLVALHKRARKALLPPAVAGEPALVRLVAGVARRAQGLQARVARLPRASRVAAAPLLAAAEEAEALCAQVLARAAVQAEQGDSEAEAARDRLVERLLVIGAALDEALGGGEQVAASAQRVDSALRRLRGEAALSLLAPEAGPADAPTAVALRVR